MKQPILLSVLCFFAFTLSAQTDLSLKLQAILKDLQSTEELGYAMLPVEAQIVDFQLQNKTLDIHLEIPIDFLYRELDAEMVDEIIEHFSVPVSEFGVQIIMIKAKDENGRFRHLSDFLGEPQLALLPAQINEDKTAAIKGQRGVDHYSDVQPKGQLENKTVWLSAGHGWIYDRRRKAYRTQRGNTHGLVEDFSNVESVNYHLLRYLYQAGANVWTVRERDMNPNEVIVDNDAGAPSYREYGKWATSRTRGYKGKQYRYAITRKKESATAVFTPNIPSSGLYWVSVRYVPGANRTVDARYRILHAGGESHVSINQEIHGNTWVYLGQFYFEKGKAAKVIVSNQSNEKSQAIIADAVRFGGGMGDVADCHNGALSQEPRFEEGAKYYARFQGYPDCSNDITIRPKYAEWELAKGSPDEQRNAIYLSWHSNANGGRGTESYVHNYRATRGSRDLQRLVHRSLINDIKDGYDAAWPDRGRKSADFGELRGLQKMPGVLLEVGFHDEVNDARALSEPQFRQLLARATYKGIARYFAAKEGKKPVFLPEPPTHLVARNTGAGKVKLTWNAPPSGGIFGDRAKTYQVYGSTHGKAFAAGENTRGQSYTFENLQPGTIYYFRVAAVNEGGESFPTAVVAVRTPLQANGQAEYLIVDGYDRLDRNLGLIVTERLLGNTRRLFLEKMNNFDYAAEHARSLASAGLAFDGATNEAVIDGKVKLDKYQGINWFVGRESLADKTLDVREQQLLTKYLRGGGRLIISGSELGYTLAHKSQGKAFYEQYLKADFKGDDARMSRFSSFIKDDFGNLEGSLKNQDYGAYPLQSPDYIRARGGGRPILQYKNGKTAAVAYKGKFGLVHFAFPLESIADDQVRNELMRRSVEYLEGAGNKSNDLVQLPKSFSETLVIDMGMATEGRAAFQLYDSKGKAVFSHKWRHNGRDDQTFPLQQLPAAAYTYAFEINGQHQKGWIRKE